MSRYSFEQAKSYSGQIIDVNERTGIPAEHREVIYNAMKGLETEERLVVTLFFMADLPVEAHSYDNIESNLRQIFPPIGKKRLKPDDFHKFRETCITSVLKANSEYFVSPKRGRWLNTDAGNQAAIRILKKEIVLMNLPRKP
ncbi:MAG: hypothetical protein U0790_28100 [Isosphaeraceae bacterium]